MRRHGRGALFLWLWVIACCYWAGEVRADSCGQFVEDFSGLSPYTWNYDNSGWSVQNQRLNVGPLPAGKLAVARVSFYPYEPYTADVDVSFLGGSDSQAALGIYTLTNGDFLFDINGHTVDGVAAFYFPNTNEVQLTSWDVTAEDWYDAGIRNATSPVSSIGFEISQTSITLRVNKVNTNLKFSGAFGNVHSVINELWLLAQGAGTSAWFDDVCVENAGAAGSDPTLTVIRSGTGSGAVTSSPAGISCGSDCSEQYTAGTSVALTATADSGSTFAGWSGGGCSGAGPCSVTLNADTTVTATFDSGGAPDALYDGIWKDSGLKMNFYVQTYTAGSVIVIATPDLADWYAFLDADYSDGVDVPDLAGRGARLTWNFTSETQAAATLITPGAGSITYTVTKHFAPPASPVFHGIWKSPSCESAEMNYYVQSYDTGSGVVIATRDLTDIFVFLDGDFSDGVDVDDLAGSGRHLTMQFGAAPGSGAQTLARCFEAPNKGSAGAAAAFCALEIGSQGGVVYGPNGSSIDLGVKIEPGRKVTVTAGDPSDILESGETSMSGAIRIGAAGASDPVRGSGLFTVRIPVTSEVADPNRLTMKARLTTGLILPVYGAYDAASKMYEAQTAALYDGWVLGVVSNPGMTVYEDSGDIGPAAWQTGLDWETFDWRVVDERSVLTDVNVRELQSAFRTASRTLSDLLFRAPKLWIQTLQGSKARVIQNVARKLQFYQPGSEESANFSLVSRTEEEMLALGQMYIDYALAKSYAPRGVNLNHIVIHELLHAVQAGYDIRAAWGQGTHSLKPYYEGTAAPVGQSYQANNGSITGPVAAVRNIQGGGPEFALLNRAVDDYTIRGENNDFYSKQDFFTYITKVYNSNDWSRISTLFKDLHDATLNRFGLSMAQYKSLYRKGLSTWIGWETGKGLSDVYAQYALDRAYKHPPEAILRTSEDFKVNKLAETLFTANTGIQTLDADNKIALFESVEPLSTYAVKIPVPANLQTDEDSTLLLRMGIENGELNPDGIRITLFRENSDRVMVNKEGEFQITDISEPVQVTVNKEVTNITLLISNCYVDEKTVGFVVTKVERPLILESELVLVNTSGPEDECDETARIEWNCDDGNCRKYEGVVWSGARFSYRLEVQGELLLRIEGEVSADESSLLSFEFETYIFPVKISANNMPLVSRTEAGLVYEVKGNEVPEHVSCETNGWFDSCIEDTIIVDQDTFLRITLPR